MVKARKMGKWKEYGGWTIAWQVELWKAWKTEMARKETGVDDYIRDG